MSFVQNVLSTTLHTMVYHMRYSGAHVIHKENVAEHSYYVTLLADLFARDITEQYSVSLDRLKILQMALYHDTEEAYTGDLITPVKNKSQELKKEWDKMCLMMMKEGLNHDFPGHSHIIQHISNIHEKYEEGKNSLLENQIVKFADGVQSIVYLLREIGFGNKHVYPILRNIMGSIHMRFDDHRFLEKYVKELEKVVENSLNGNCTIPTSALQVSTSMK